LRTIALLTDRSSLVMGALALALGLGAGCGEAGPGSNDEGASPGAPGAVSPPASVETLTYEAPLGDTTWIFAHVEAEAVCVVHDVGVPAAEAAPIYADAAGWIRVGIMPSPTDPAARAALDCTGRDGSVVERTLMIRSIPAGAVPANNPSPPPVVARRTVPALEGDPMAPSQKELRARGYPPRPDPVRSPSGYAAWRTLVSTPYYVPLAEPVRGGARKRSGATAGSDQSLWSGAVTVVAQGTYSAVSANWTVPKLNLDPARAYSLYATSVWAGLGGNPDLIQAGVQDTLTMVSSNVGVVTHQGFYESTHDTSDGEAVYLPGASYPISHGDAVFSETFVCSYDGLEYDPSGTYGCFLVYDTTAGWGTEAVLPIDGSSSLVDYTAEWIVERPNLGQPIGLADYGSVVFTNVQANSVAAFDTPLQSMVNSNGDLLSYPTWESNGDLLLTYVRSE
jgi:hypothetical protein